MKLFEKMKRFYLKKQSNGGFTLVELIVVIAILAILAGIAVPAYSGYVEKAERANDEALLAEINTAFASACMMNGQSNYGRDDVVATLNDGTFTYNAPFADSFNGFYEGGEFKVFTGMYYEKTLGQFVEGVLLTVTTAEGKTYSYVADAAMAESLANSAFMNEMGIDTTLGIMDMVTQYAVDLAASQSESLNSVYSDQSFLKSLARYAGVEYVEGDDLEALGEKMAAANISDPDTAIGNAIVLYAAEQSSSMTVDSVKQLLGSNADAKATIVGNLTGGQPAIAMAQTAAAYSLYTSYLYSLDDNYTTEDGKTKQQLIDAAYNNPVDTLSGLDDDGFKAYINNSSNDDISGYLNAVGMLTDAADTSNGVGGTASKDILNEGFNTDWLANLLGQVTDN